MFFSFVKFNNVHRHPWIFTTPPTKIQHEPISKVGLPYMHGGSREQKISQIAQHLFFRYLRHQELTDSIPFDAMGKCFFEWLCLSNSKNKWLRFQQNHVSICVCDIHINLIHFGNIYFSFCLLFNRII